MYIAQEHESHGSQLSNKQFWEPFVRRLSLSAQSINFKVYPERQLYGALPFHHCEFQVAESVLVFWNDIGIVNVCRSKLDIFSLYIPQALFENVKNHWNR